jgi:hypothetical protein
MPKARQMTFIDTSKIAQTRPVIPQTDRDKRMAAISFLSQERIDDRVL